MPVSDHVLSLPRELACEFFFEFARFEFALKATGFAIPEGNGVKPDWVKFSAELDARFDRNATPELREAVNYLLSRPPRKQTLRGGTLSWTDGSPPPNFTELRRLLFCVQRVRNNLFHGAKFLAREDEEHDRDSKLALCSLAVLRECLRLHGNLAHAFDAEVL